MEHFFRVYMASSKHEEGWENSRQLRQGFAQLSRILQTPRVFGWGYVKTEKCSIALKRHNRVYRLSSKHTYRLMRARVEAQLFCNRKYRFFSWMDVKVYIAVTYTINRMERTTKEVIESELKYI